MKRRYRTLCVVTALCCVWGGCEERVVKVHNSYIDNSMATEHAYDPVPQRKRGFFDEVGEFMFGWTRHLGLGGKRQPQPATPTPDSPGTTTESGS